MGGKQRLQRILAMVRTGHLEDGPHPLPTQNKNCIALLPNIKYREVNFRTHLFLLVLMLRSSFSSPGQELTHLSAEKKEVIIRSERDEWEYKFLRLASLPSSLLLRNFLASTSHREC